VLPARAQVLGIDPGEEAGMKTYLGDSVYADFQDGQIILTTENGLSTDPSNTIILEPEVYVALTWFVAKLTRKEGTE
jgi:hypothetical protein